MTSTVTSRWSPIRRSVALVVATCLCTESAFAMVLADAGRARATIVIGAEAREREKLAARELARYLGLMSGATFNVTTTTGDGPTIFVGTMPQTEPIVEALRQHAQEPNFRLVDDRLVPLRHTPPIRLYVEARDGKEPAAGMLQIPSRRTKGPMAQL